MNDRLFDVPAVAVPEPERLSADRRRTIKQREMLAKRRHPATGLELIESHTCGECAHHHAYGYGNHVWHKCERHRLGESHSAASDIRVGWPACTSFEAES